MYLIACIYYLSKLNAHNLREAYESLHDMYDMQQASRTISHEVENATRFVPISRTTRVENPPFAR